MKGPFLRSSVLRALGLACLLGACASAPTVSPADLAREYYTLGNAYFELKKYPEAVNFYRRALEWEGGNAEAVFNLARSLAETGAFAEAQERLRPLRESDPQNQMVRKVLAYLAFADGRYDEALSLYRDLLAETPQDSETLYNAALTVLRLESVPERDQEAAAWLNTHRALANPQAGAPGLLADLYARLGDSEGQLTALEAAREQRQARPDYWAALGPLYEAKDLTEKALEAWDQVIQRQSTDKGQRGLAQFRAARLRWLKTLEFDRAAALFREAWTNGYTEAAAWDALLNEEGLPESSRLQGLFTEVRKP